MEKEADLLSQTIGIYDEIAGEYATTWFEDRVMEPALNRFLGLLPQHGDVLDAGCGPGRDVLAMARRGFPAVGIDLSRSMIAEARVRVPDHVFRRMDLRRLNYPAETFRGVWACASLQHLLPADTARCLAEFTRVLMPRGILAVAVEEGKGEKTDHCGRYVKLYEREELAQIVSAAGFRVLAEELQGSEKSTLGERRRRNWLHVFAEKAGVARGDASECQCIFCPAARLELTRDLPFAGSESILWGDRNFWVIPDVAPLVDGHLLLITASHYPCFGAWPEDLDPELRAAQDFVRNLLAQTYGEPVLFLEHGPARPGGAGSCIEHAHWHCLPTSLPVRRAVEQRLGKGELASLDDLRSFFNAGKSYLYIQEPDYACAFPVDDLPSQFLRQVVASLRGQDVWRWQTVAGRDMAQTLRRNVLDRLLPLLDERLL